MTGETGEPGEVVIRSAEERDVGTLAGLLGELGYPISEADMSNRLAFVASSPNDELFIAELDGLVVGFVALRTMEFVHRVARYGQITAMCVSGKHRRRGVGSRLVEHVEALLRQRGIIDMQVYTGVYRKDEAHEFYRAIGYEATGVRFVKRMTAGGV